jgi:general secretion pathway protein L
LINSIRHAIDWLVEGLVQAFMAVEERLRPRARFVLVRKSDGFALQRPNGQVIAERLQIDGPAADIPAEAATLIKDADIDVALLPEELLIRTLDPLPAQSKPYVDGIVRHQLERLTPWRAADVLYSYQAVPAGQDDSRLTVTLAATARSLQRRRLEQVAALQPHSLRLVYHDPADNKDFAIDVTGNESERLQTQYLRRAIGWSAAGLGSVTVLAVVLLIVAWQRTDAALESAEKDVADLRAKLAAAGPTVSSADRDLEAVFNRRLNAPYSVIAFNALAEVLPDDTFLTEFRVGDGHVRMTGVSRSVSQLVPLLEASPMFDEVTFFAPTTRLPNNQGDRFNLDAKLVAAGAQKR